MNSTQMDLGQTLDALNVINFNIAAAKQELEYLRQWNQALKVENSQLRKAVKYAARAASCHGCLEEEKYQEERKFIYKVMGWQEEE